MTTNTAANLPVECLKCGLKTAWDVLLLSATELSLKTGLNFEYCKKLQKQLSVSLHPLNACKSIPAFSDILTFKCASVDDLMGGGLPEKGITEIFGESASCKTQLCLQLAANLSTEHKILYISTEGPIPIRRLEQIGETSALSRILVEHVNDAQELLNLLEKYNSFPPLLIIDSIAAPFRAEENRYKILSQVIALLLMISKKYRVLCTNQITSDPQLGVDRPALGLQWENAVTSRFKTSRTTVFTDNDICVRKIEVIFAPHLRPNGYALFYPTNGGLVSYNL